jgi:hypothetical protein
MSQFLEQILTLLTTPPGNLVYHIVLVFSIAGALLGAFQSLRSSNFHQGWRTVIGLSIMLGLQLVLFGISGLTWQGLLNAQMVLPPLDRAVTLLMLTWVAWLWAFPKPVRMADAATLLLNLLAVAVLGLTLVFWVQNPASSFNLSVFETGWQVFSIAVILLGILGLVLRKPNGWFYGLAMLILGFGGHFASLVYPINGNFPGIVRLVQLAMFPILLMLSQRFSFPTQVQAPVLKPRKFDESFQERRRYSTDPKTFHALMSLAAETDPGKIGQALVRGIAQAMLADLCFLINLGEDKALAITCGYDLIREKNLAGTTMDSETIPLLANAIQQGHPLRLSASNNSSDLKGLGRIFSLRSPGNLLSVPVTSPECGPLGSVLILSPHSNRLWSAEDQTFLSNVSPLIIPILERGQRAGTLQNEQLRNAGGTPSPTNDQLERELRQTLEEMAHMQNALADANNKIIELEKRPVVPFTTEQVEFKPEPIDLNLIIDNAMAHTSTQIREKNITLRLDLTDTAPRIRTDRDALQQILIHLLQNATAATQKEGNIILRVQMQDEVDNHFLSIQVADNGGGIALEDIPHVFDRRYRAEHSPIQGLGDTGVGLSTAKALVEAQNGRIWVETEAGVGSTFSILMPVEVDLPIEN